MNHPYAFITSEMRTGKSRIVIDYAQFLFVADQIDHVLVVAPAPVRDVWYDPVLGEIAKHAWHSVPATIEEFHGRHRSWFWGDPRETAGRKRLHYTITNYEFIRAKRGSKLKRSVDLFPKVCELLQHCDARTLLVLDESSYVKSWDSAQTQACQHLRAHCGRVVLLNGTPISHTPRDLFSQGNMLHRSILDCAYITHFDARYAVKEPVLTYGGKPLTKVVRGGREITIEKTTGWRNLEDLQRRFDPVTVRRLQKDCPDMPVKLDPVVLTATLTPPTWKAYSEMKKEMVIWLESGQVSTAQTAAVKAMRLSQITSGFVGGIEDELPQDVTMFEDKDFGLTGVFGGLNPTNFEEVIAPPKPKFENVGREKLDVVLWKLEQIFDVNPNEKVVVWVRFRQELERYKQEILANFGVRALIGSIHGGQNKKERTDNLSLLHPDTAPPDGVIMLGTLGTGSFGLNFSAAKVAIFASTDYSLGKYLQAADRIYGPGDQTPRAYYDVVAVGPKGQKTIDHAVVAARRNNEDVANWTSAAWIKALKDE